MNNILFDHNCNLQKKFFCEEKNKIEMEIEEEEEKNEEGAQEKEKLHIIEIKNEENEKFLKCPMLLYYQTSHMDFIRNFFSCCPSEMPYFYSINKRILSMNCLQQNRYFEEEFLYYQTKYRCEIKNQIDEHIKLNPFSIIHLTGLMTSGKSYFLSDYVLRERVQGKNSKVRILYINNSEEFLRSPIMYLFNEIKYMLFFDFFENNKFDLKKCFDILNKELTTRALDTYLDFFLKMKNDFNSIGIQLIIIWDQINVMYREKNRHTKEFKIYKILTSSITFFNHIILSASNNNEEINIEHETVRHLEINPFEIFNKTEFRALIQAEIHLWNLVPSDIKKENLSQYANYISDLCELLNFSMSEYHSYKSIAWDNKLHDFTIKDSNFQINISRYLKNRIVEIENSEEKFREEYLKHINDLEDYYMTLKKTQVYSQKDQIFKRTTDSYTFIKNPKTYNKQFFFYIEKEKVLVCASFLIRDSIQNLLFYSISNKLIPWKKELNLSDGNLFQLCVQNYYLNNKSILSFGNKFAITIHRKRFFYECGDTINEIMHCKDSGLSFLCHFLQVNHFAFDSMIYDGSTNTLIMIQITVNENHEIHYDLIESFIKNLPFQLKLGQQKDYFLKYKLFFDDLMKRNLVSKFVFQWMTNKKLEKLIEKSNKEKEKLSDKNFFEIFPYHEGLINEIEEGKLK